MRTWVKFGHTQHWVPVTFPLTSSRTRHARTHTLTRCEILLKLCFKCSTFPVTTRWTSIDTSACTLHAKKRSHAEIYLQEFRKNSYDTTVCGLGHLDVTCRCCNKYITHWIFLFLFIQTILTNYSDSLLICWNLLTPFGRPLRWFKKRRSLSSSGQRSPSV